MGTNEGRREGRKEGGGREEGREGRKEIRELKKDRRTPTTAQPLKCPEGPGSPWKALRHFREHAKPRKAPQAQNVRQGD